MSSSGKKKFPHAVSNITSRRSSSSDFGGIKVKTNKLVSGPLSRNKSSSGSFGSNKGKQGSKKNHSNRNERVALDNNRAEPLSFTTTSSTTNSKSLAGGGQSKDNLSPLKDNNSNYELVRESCLLINQFVGGGGMVTTAPASPTVDAEGIAKSFIFHDKSFANTVSSMLKALVECIRNHHDRRCRIVACKTVAILARSSYARIRHTPLLFSIKENTMQQLEDEILPEIPVILSTVAIDDIDDGVSACAIESLGLLTLSTCPIVNTIVDDELVREIDIICNNRFSPYAPSLLYVADEDISIPQMEIQCRIYENVISPRLFRLVRRIVSYDTSSHNKRILPFLSSCLTYLIKTNARTTYGVDRTNYAKRWMEVDIASIVYDVVHLILLPSMQCTLYDNEVRHAAALSGIRLASACHNAPWVSDVCHWAVIVLSENLSSSYTSDDNIEHISSTLAALLISLRAIPKVIERLPYLDLVTNVVISTLPPTRNVPIGVDSAGVVVTAEKHKNSHSDRFYRIPSRIGFFTEIALSLFVDGSPSGFSSVNSSKNNDINSNRSEALDMFLTSEVVNVMITSRSGKTKTKPTKESCSVPMHVAEELVLSFSMVASAVGRRLFPSHNQKKRKQEQPLSYDDDSEILLEWLQSSAQVLSVFSSCLNWNTTNEKHDHEEDGYALSPLTTVAQTHYMALLLECLFIGGLIEPMSSVSLRMIPRATPSRCVVFEQLSRSASSLLANFVPTSSMFDQTYETLNKLMDQLLNDGLSEGVQCRYLRLTILALLTDHWVQHRRISTAQFNNNEELNINLDEANAREIISLLSLELSSSNDDDTTTDKSLLVCVACIENIALTACDAKRRFGKSARTPSPPDRNALCKDIEEGSNDIISTSLTALPGEKNHVNGNNVNGEKSVSSKDRWNLQTESCFDNARRRIQASCDSAVEDDTAWGFKAQPALFSPLILGNRDTNSGTNQWASKASTGSKDSSNFIKATLYPFIPHDVNTCQSLDVKQPFEREKYFNSYLSLYCQQLVFARINASILPHSQENNAIEMETDSVEYLLERPRNSLRLDLYSPSIVRKHHMISGPGDRLCWNSSVSTIFGSSDPVSLVLAFAVRRQPRYDYETEYKLTVTLRLYNTTAVEIAEGVRMSLGVSLVGVREELDKISKQIASALNSRETDYQEDYGTTEPVFVSSATVVYKQKVEPGDFLTWEVTLDSLPERGKISLHPSVTFREIDSEPITSTWTSLPKDARQNSEENAGENTVPDNNIDEVKDGIRLDGEPVRMSPLVVLRPCPFVFFLGDGGNVNAFRFLWFNLPYRVPSLQLSPSKSPTAMSGSLLGDELGAAIAAMSSVELHPENRMPANIIKGWALSDTGGKKVICLLVASSTSADLPTQPTKTKQNCTLHIRGDDKNLLLSLCGSKATRSAFIYGLTSTNFDCSLVAQRDFGNGDVTNFEHDNIRVEI